MTDLKEDVGQSGAMSLGTDVQTNDVSHAGDGFLNAIDRIADDCRTFASQNLPVLEVDSGILVSLVFSQGVMLSAKRWDEIPAASQQQVLAA